MRFIIRVVINAFAIWVVTLIPTLQVSVTPFPPGHFLQLAIKGEPSYSNVPVEQPVLRQDAAPTHKPSALYDDG